MTVIGGMDPDAAPLAAPWVQMVSVGDETVLVDEPNCRSEAINGTASLVWQCLDGKSRLGDIAADLADVFGEDRSIVLSDVLGLVNSLSERRFVIEDRGNVDHFDESTTTAPDLQGGGVQWRNCEPDPLDARMPAPDFLGVPPNR